MYKKIKAGVLDVLTFNEVLFLCFLDTYKSKTSFQKLPEIAESLNLSVFKIQRLTTALFKKGYISKEQTARFTIIALTENANQLLNKPQSNDMKEYFSIDFQAIALKEHNTPLLTCIYNTLKNMYIDLDNQEHTKGMFNIQGLIDRHFLKVLKSNFRLSVSTSRRVLKEFLPVLESLNDDDKNLPF
jgi:DNA-binding MarR family transcriptional regulator